MEDFMALADILGRETVRVSGKATATNTAKDFVIQGSQTDVLNYARRGNDLVVQMKNGRIHTIRNFAEHGFDFNHLAFADQDKLTLVDFSKALTSSGDGIIEAAVTAHGIGAGLSTTALLGLLGAIPIPFLKDTSQPPAAPTVHFATDTAANDGLTSDNTLVFTGSAASGTIVEIFLNNQSIGTAITDSHGVWSFDYSGTALPDGSYTVTAKATDADGNDSPSSPPLSITIDTVAPDAPTILTMSPDTGVPEDGITSHHKPTFTGTAEANATVKIFVGDTLLGSTTADAHGAWTLYEPDNFIFDSTYDVTAIAMDAAGNLSPVSPPLSITVDTTAPDAPTFLKVSSDTAIAHDWITSDNTLSFSGGAEPNATVEFFLGDQSIGTTTADENGAWNFDYAGTELIDGSYTLTAIATDVAGNASPNSQSYALVIDTSITAPEILSISDDGGVSQNDGITDDNTLIFTGLAEANGSIELFIDGTSIGTSTVNGLGEWSFDYTGTTLANGSYVVTAVATDVAGNISEPSADFALTVNAATVTITGNGDNGGQITFTFSEPVEASSFTESDIQVANGILVPYTLEQIDATTWRATVEADLPENTTNVAVTIAAGSVLTAGGAYFGAGANVTSLDMIFADTGLPSSSVAMFDTSHATSAYGTFYANTTFNEDIGGWDVSNITNMEEMFGNTDIFNQDIGGWNTSKVASMAYMFNLALAFNQDIDGWNVSSVTTMDAMFDGAAAFNQNLDNWDTSSLTSMYRIFADAVAFNGQVGNWDTSEVTQMSELFSGATSFNQDIGNWNTASATSMSQMFRNATSFNQDIGAWNVGSVTDVSSMFYGAAAFNQDLNNWNVATVEHFDGMFYGATAFDGDISQWNIAGASSLRFMFNGATSFNQDIGGWDTSNITSLFSTFKGASAFDQDLGSWNTGNVTTMEGAFYNAAAFDADISEWDTSEVTSMKDMFRGASSFDQDLGSWDISSLTDASGMFLGSGISAENMDATLRGWAKLDTAAGETAIQMDVDVYVGHHTDVTAFVYLQEKYHWHFSGELDASVRWDSSLTGTTMDYSSSTANEIMHGLYGNDIMIGGSGNDWIVGGEGNDTLTGNGGRDTFHFGFENAGSDTITDFEIGQSGDIIDLSDLLIGYNPSSSTLSDFVTASDNGGNLELSIFYKGQGTSTPLQETVHVTFSGINSTTSLQDLVNDGNLVLV